MNKERLEYIEGYLEAWKYNKDLPIVNEIASMGLECIEAIYKQLEENEKLKKTMIQAARGSANIVNLAEENVQWETNYNNLSAEYEEVSAIAQAQEKAIEELAKALQQTWDNVFFRAEVPQYIIQTLAKARQIVQGGK